MTDIADWTKIPKTLFVVGAKSVDGIGYDVLMCSVPQILKPEVAYVRADTITALRAENERLRAALETARGDLYNAANAWNDEDYRGPIPSCKGEFTAHSVDNQKRLVDWICTRAEAITTALEEKE